MCTGLWAGARNLCAAAGDLRLTAISSFSSDSRARRKVEVLSKSKQGEHLKNRKDKPFENKGYIEIIQRESPSWRQNTSKAQNRRVGNKSSGLQGAAFGVNDYNRRKSEPKNDESELLKASLNVISEGIQSFGHTVRRERKLAAQMQDNTEEEEAESSTIIDPCFVERPLEEKDNIRLAPDVNCPVTLISFRVRTADRRIVLKLLGDLKTARSVSETLVNRLIRVNDIVIHDSSILLKPMDTLDIWRSEHEENEAFARVERFQVLDLTPAKNYEYYTVRMLGLREYVTENWLLCNKYIKSGSNE